MHAKYPNYMHHSADYCGHLFLLIAVQSQIQKPSLNTSKYVSSWVQPVSLPKIQWSTILCSYWRW